MSAIKQLTKMEKARSRMLIKHAFFATLLLSTEMVETEEIPTAATDMRRIFYNLKFIESLDLEVVTFVIAHEALHMMFKHGLRRQTRNPILWNIAGDFAINAILNESGFKLWDKALYHKDFDHKSAEEIYDILQKEAEKASKGKPSKYGDLDTVSGTGQDVLEPENAGPEEKAKIERDVQQKIAHAAAMARKAGQMPAGLEKMINDILNPQVPWEDVLRDFMPRLVRSGETWDRRNRRILDTYLPGQQSKGQMGELIIIGDTSGSMWMTKVFEQLAGEINYIREHVNPERVRVIWADDTKKAGEDIFEEGDEVVLHPKGGGGTDMRKPLKYVEQFDPCVVILVTDAETPWPQSEPAYPLIVLCTTEIDVPIGEVIRLRGLR